MPCTRKKRRTTNRIRGSDCFVEHKDVHQVVNELTTKAKNEGRIICIDDDDDGEGGAGDTREDNDGVIAFGIVPDSLIGRRVYKHFRNHGWFFGTVQHVVDPTDDESEAYYHVLYDDGDREDFALDELRPWLSHWEQKKWSDPKCKPPVAPEGKRVDVDMTTIGSPQVKLEKAHVKSEKPHSAAIVAHPHKKRVPPPQKQVLLPQKHVPHPKKKVLPPKKTLASAKEKVPPPRFNAGSYQSDIGWVNEMSQWLEQGNLSAQNGRTVLRQVAKLAKGQGISYPRNWPDHIVFLKGLPVNLTYDFDEMMAKARGYEKTHGRDKGNGWLLQHPIKKLKLYQQHRGIKPSVSSFSL